MMNKLSKNTSFSFIGNGKMSKAIQQLATENNIPMGVVIDKSDLWDLPNNTLVFEVSTPDVFLDNFKKLCRLQKDVIIITTGWYSHLEEVKQLTQNAGNRVLWSSNFSIGVYLYFKIVEKAAQLINTETNYDIWATEIHHTNKVDSPSGTAKTLENILLNAIDRKTSVVEETLHRKIKDTEIHFSSTRGGLVNFGHTIGFDSVEDCIEIKHTARNRNGYALGAIKAADWLQKQPAGFYSMDDFMQR